MAARVDQCLLSTNEAAEFVQNSARTFSRWRSQGVGPSYVRVGGKIRYQQSDLKEWVTRHRVHPVREPQ